VAISGQTTGKSFRKNKVRGELLQIKRFIGKKVLAELGMATETPQYLEKEGYTKGQNQEVIVTILTRNLES